jgi:hypothetical protein
LLREIDRRAAAIFALATALFREPATVGRNVALLERKQLVHTRRVPNPGHDTGALKAQSAAKRTTSCSWTALLTHRTASPGQRPRMSRL